MNGSAVTAPSMSLADAARLASSVMSPEPPPAPTPQPQTAANDPSVIVPPTPFAFEPPPGFTTIPQDFLVYHPDFGQGRAIYGMLVDAIPLLWTQASNSQGVIPAMYGLIVQLIEETLVIDPTWNTAIVAKSGQEIMVGADHVALRRLVRAALDPKQVGEVWLRPNLEMQVKYGEMDYRAWDTRAGRTFRRQDVKRTGQ